MTLPNFLILGAQKAGTTWLATMLRKHPAIFMPKRELHFFDKSYNYERGLEWYERQFDGWQGEQAIGEKTPDYLWAQGRGAEGHLPMVHRNIQRALSRPRFIVILRDPVQRAVSAVNHLIRSGRISPLHRIGDLLTGSGSAKIEEHGIIEKGFYFRQLQAYLEIFDREQFLILIYEEHIARHGRLGLSRACDFLGVDPDFHFHHRERRINAPRRSRLRLIADYYLPPLRSRSAWLDRHFKAWKGQPRARVVRELAHMYADENERLFAFLGHRPRRWISPSSL